MRINDKIRDEKVQYHFNRKAETISHYHLEKLVNINFLQAKKYYHLIKVE